MFYKFQLFAVLSKISWSKFEIFLVYDWHAIVYRESLILGLKTKFRLINKDRINFAR